MWLPCNNICNYNISLQPNSPRLLLLCSWITKCSKPSSSNSGFETDYIKSFSNPIPPDFYFCVLESQNTPNHHHHHLLLLLQILVLGMTTKNLSPTVFLQTFVCVFLNHKMLQIFFIYFYFVGPHIEQWWRCFESFTFITLKNFGLFWGRGGGELSTFQEFLATRYPSPPLTRSQFLEGLKGGSQIEDSGKRKGVGTRSLIRSIRGVEGRAGALGLD
jgi:hypothetical protein